MPAVARSGDRITTGHTCDVTATLVGVVGSSLGVFVNGKGIQLKGDPVGPHTYDPGGGVCVPHIAFVTGGSGSVFVGGTGVARVGDSADQGAIIQGSTDVFAGG